MNPYVLIAVGVLWALSVAGASVKWAGLKVAEVQSAYLARDNTALADANAEIQRLQDAARATEAQRVQDMNTIAANYGKGYEDAEARRRRDVAAARDGALVLRVPASACRTGPSEAGPAGSSSPGGDGAAPLQLPGAAGGGVLPPEITADLYALADDADQVADQLRACQSVVLADRKESP